MASEQEVMANDSDRQPKIIAVSRLVDLTDEEEQTRKRAATDIMPTQTDSIKNI